MDERNQGERATYGEWRRGEKREKDKKAGIEIERREWTETPRS